MTWALSTCWFPGDAAPEAVVEKALALGFGALEIGYAIDAAAAERYRAVRDRIPIGSVHAFAPVPISAPYGHPELYPLASFDAEARKMARFQLLRTVRFAADVGARTVVLHAGRVASRGFLRRWDAARRRKRGRRLVDVFRRELDGLRPELKAAGVDLGLENLPYQDGFPNETELRSLVGDGVFGWYDTGHGHVRRTSGWETSAPDESLYVGLHVNDSLGGDDHLAPGRGQIDFAELKPLAQRARHLVFEPARTVGEADLRAGLLHIQRLWTP